MSTAQLWAVLMAVVDNLRIGGGKVAVGFGITQIQWQHDCAV